MNNCNHLQFDMAPPTAMIAPAPTIGGEKHRDISFQCLLNLPFPYAEISYQGEICVAKADGSCSVLNFGTCAQQLLYEITDPSAYITPDMVLDMRDVTFKPLSSTKILCTRAKPSTISTPEKFLKLVPKMVVPIKKILYAADEKEYALSEAQQVLSESLDFDVVDPEEEKSVD
ncbi:hypothetical protein BVRB_6g146040 [Beta vulgaris subsp. vulgaris]|nr:hypothetical protein BVRB_6g146040 [Beta vulgaris subsp. vulgaris]